MPYTVEELKKVITPIARNYGVDGVFLFGSYSKGTATADSDLDLIIQKGKLRSLFQLSGFRLDLEDALSIPVDLITTECVDREFLHSVQKDGMLIYGIQG